MITYAEAVEICKEHWLEPENKCDRAFEYTKAWSFSSTAWENMIGPSPVIVMKDTGMVTSFVEDCDMGVMIGELDYHTGQRVRG